MSLTTYDQRTVASKLGRSLKTFQNSKRQFFAVGMPLPAELPGNPVWFADEFDTWLLSRSPNRQVAPAPVADVPAEDLPAINIPTDQPAKRRGAPTAKERAAARRLGLSVPEMRSAAAISAAVEGGAQ